MLRNFIFRTFENPIIKKIHINAKQNLNNNKNNSISTIYAVSSGQGRCGVALIRISGPKTKFILSKLIKKIPKPRYASLNYIYRPDTKDILDKGIILWYPSLYAIIII